MTEQAYPHLWSPITLSGHTLRNRSIMGSMHIGLEEAKGGFEKMAAFYRERAEGGAGLIITGGIAPHWRGWLAPFASKLTNRSEVGRHRHITEAVHSVDGKIALQILHAGRYSFHPFPSAPSAIKSPISKFKPFALSRRGIQNIIQAFIDCAARAREAGYDGVEIMGSEGYLLNQFIAQRTNKRRDEYGGSFENRTRIVREIVTGVRTRCGADFMIIFRLSLLDLVEEGSSWQENVMLAHQLREAGVSLINTGIGWHEARIPTIATCVPRGAFSWVTAKLRGEIDVPLAAANRINTPEMAEQILARGEADMVSMARPFLADAAFMKKAERGEAHLINTCIACNQACLDHIFVQKQASCLVNPRACYEKEYPLIKGSGKAVAVVGGGPAGLAAAVYAAERGYKVTLYEKKHEIGGQFHYAKKIPGKEEFKETLRYFSEMLKKLDVKVVLGQEVTPEILKENSFAAVALASGVRPRTIRVPGADEPYVQSYDQAILAPEKIGRRVAIIGSGGIGIDTAVLLLHSFEHDLSRPKDFYKYWGIDQEYRNRGGLAEAENFLTPREITIFQRSQGKPGRGLGKTTSWIHKLHLKRAGVRFVVGAEYLSFEKHSVRYRVEDREKTLDCDHIIICAGQESYSGSWQDYAGATPVTVIGGVKDAVGIDAKRAIREAFLWAQKLD